MAARIEMVAKNTLPGKGLVGHAESTNLEAYLPNARSFRQVRWNRLSGHVGPVNRPESAKSDGADHGLHGGLRGQDFGAAAPMMDVPDGCGDSAIANCGGADPEHPSYQVKHHNSVSYDPRTF